MKKTVGKPLHDLWPVYVRLDPSLVAWLDSEARRQRRSRAYVISQAVRVLRAMLENLDQEKAT